MTSNPPIADTTMRPIAQSVGVPKATDPALMATIPQMASRRVLPVCLLLTHGETAAVPEEQIRSTDVGCGRVEDGRGSLGHAATPRFPSPLIKPNVPISGIRLSDW